LVEGRKFTYDEAKRRGTLRKHKIDFRDIERVFDGPNVDDYDDAHSEGEERWRRLVWLGGRVVVVVYTEQGDHIRLITAFDAAPEETKRFIEIALGGQQS
jgi:uncharacterized DUF497 family protein